MATVATTFRATQVRKDVATFSSISTTGFRTLAFNNDTDSQFLNDSATMQEGVISNINPRLASGIIVLVLLILNLLGNSVVFYVYRFLIKASVFSFYVSVLSSLDIITALTTMLLDIIIKMRPLDERILHLSYMCKITHFQVYAHSLISGCVLTLIAYQRYRKICRPLDTGFTIRTAKLALVIIVTVCLLLSVSSLVLNGPQDVQVKVYNHVVNVTICRYDENYEWKSFQTALSIFLMCAFSLVLSLTIICYVMVASTLRKFERRNSIMSARIASPDINLINKNHGHEINKPDRGDADRKQIHRQSNWSQGDYHERISTQMFRVFATITLIFIISYLPHLLVLILTKSLSLDQKVLTTTQRTLLDLAYNCPYISTVANPIVYGFRSAEFRKHFKEITKCWR